MQFEGDFTEDFRSKKDKVGVKKRSGYVDLKEKSGEIKKIKVGKRGR